MDRPHATRMEEWRRISQNHFSKITPHYDRGRAFEQGHPWAEEIQRHTPVNETDWMLDLGCGTGLLTTHFAEKLPGHVAGIEFSRAMLQQALQKEKTANLDWVQGAGESLPFANQSLKAIFLSQVWHHLPDPEYAAREMFRCLAPGGGLYIKTFSHDQIKARWDLREIFPELMPFMLGIYPDFPDIRSLLEGVGFSQVVSKSYHKEDVMRPSHMLSLMRQKAWSMFSFLSPEGGAEGEARLNALIAAGDQPVPYPEIHLLVIARRQGS
jgi:ubiquinone/menaquinone biosynthesis C-methylase UbiE